MDCHTWFVFVCSQAANAFMSMASHVDQNACQELTVLGYAATQHRVCMVFGLPFMPSLINWQDLCLGIQGLTIDAVTG